MALVRPHVDATFLLIPDGCHRTAVSSGKPHGGCAGAQEAGRAPSLEPLQPSWIQHPEYPALGFEQGFETQTHHDLSAYLILCPSGCSNGSGKDKTLS